MEYQTGCLVCGKPLVYSESAGPADCVYCGARKQTNATCIDGHYVCDVCHSASARDLIETYCRVPHV
jgi:rubredoxin